MTSRSLRTLLPLAGACLSLAAASAHAQGAPQDLAWQELAVPSDVVVDMGIDNPLLLSYVVRSCTDAASYQITMTKGRAGVDSEEFWRKRPDFSQQLKPQRLADSTRILDYDYYGELSSKKVSAKMHRFKPAPAGSQLLSGAQLVQAVDAQFPGFAAACSPGGADAGTRNRLRQTAAVLAGERISILATEKPYRSEAEARLAFSRATAALALVAPPQRVVGWRQPVGDEFRYEVAWTWPLGGDDVLEVRLKLKDGAWAISYGLEDE